MRSAVPILSLLAAVLAVTGCSKKDEGVDPTKKVPELKQAGDTALADGNLAAAGQAYEEAHALAPTDPHAAAGSAVVDILTLADSAPVTEFLDACNQPRFDVQEKIFGDDGLLARDAEIRQGSGTLKVLFRPGGTGSFTDTGFAADYFRSSFRPENPYSPSTITTTIDDVDRDEEAQLYLELNVSQIYGDDPASPPLVDGTTVDLSRWSWGWGSVQVNGYHSAGAFSGTLIFHGNPAPGGEVTVELKDVVVTACAADSPYGITCDESGCHADCPGQFHLTGTFTDKITGHAHLDEDEIPFAGLDDDEGPPHRDGLIVAIERCGSTLSTDFIAEKARALVPRLAAIADKLTAAIGSSPADASFTLPKSLFRADRDFFDPAPDVPLNGTDLLTARAFTHLSSAVLQLATSYRYIDGPLASLIGNFTYWYGESCSVDGCVPQSRSERGFLAQPLADNLAATFLTRAPGFNLDGARAELDAALADASAALRNVPTRPGLLNFQATGSMPFANQLAEQLDLVRSSLTSATPVALARNPLHRVSLRAFFDVPLDRERLLANAGLSRLFTFVPGDPAAPSYHARNAGVEVAHPDEPDDIETWTGGVVFLPHEVDTSCATDAQCPQYYRCSVPSCPPEAPCGDGYCREPGFTLVDPTTTEDWDDLPPFLNPAVKPFLRTWGD